MDAAPSPVSAGAELRAGPPALGDPRSQRHVRPPLVLKALALRSAEAGVAAITIDYFGRTAGLTSRDESFAFQPHVQQLTFDGIGADARAALAHLAAVAPAPPASASASVGFCLGGTISFLRAPPTCPWTG
ncbi:MAG: hypothetical protein HGA45_05035 [Chloroflexales bacterium]|nr:hypothetical protein [Chloroflexales bacterium]